MTNFARIINNVAVDVSTDPASQFHPSIAAEFEPVPDQVQSGWRLDGETWQAPEEAPEQSPVEVPAPEPVSVTPVTVSPVEFMLLFTSPERVGIKAARPNDPVIDDFFDIIEDPRLTMIRLDSQSTKDALDYFAFKGLIAEGRKAEILAWKGS